jgi:hypothetical protein
MCPPERPTPRATRPSQGNGYLQWSIGYINCVAIIQPVKAARHAAQNAQADTGLNVVSWEC